eukprot:750462-Hanusia_phi.AAC.2
MGDGKYSARLREGRILTGRAVSFRDDKDGAGGKKEEEGGGEREDGTGLGHSRAPVLPEGVPRSQAEDTFGPHDFL